MYTAVDNGWFYDLPPCVCVCVSVLACVGGGLGGCLRVCVCVCARMCMCVRVSACVLVSSQVHADKNDIHLWLTHTNTHTQTYARGHECKLVCKHSLLMHVRVFLSFLSLAYVCVRACAYSRKGCVRVYMRTSVCAFVHADVRACMHVRMYECVYLYVRMRMWVHAHVHMCVYASVSMDVCMRACIRVYECVICVCVCVCVCTCMRVHVCVHVRVLMQSKTWPDPNRGLIHI